MHAAESHPQADVRFSSRLHAVIAGVISLLACAFATDFAIRRAPVLRCVFDDFGVRPNDASMLAMDWAWLVAVFAAVGVIVALMAWRHPTRKRLNSAYAVAFTSVVLVVLVEFAARAQLTHLVERLTTG